LRVGVTKSTSNAANLTHLLTNAKTQQKPRGGTIDSHQNYGLHPGAAQTTLNQLLVSYGVPEAPGKLAASSSTPLTLSSSTSESHVPTEPEAEPYIAGGSQLMTLIAREEDERQVRTFAESTLSNEKLPLSQMQPMKVDLMWEEFADESKRGDQHPSAYHQDDDSSTDWGWPAVAHESLQRLWLAANSTSASQNCLGRTPQQNQDLVKVGKRSLRTEQNPNWQVFSFEL
jgi:hypothetical protein